METPKRIYNLRKCPHYQVSIEDIKHLALHLPVSNVLPEKVDLRSTGRIAPIYDQGQLGSCTANALCAAHHFIDTELEGSRLFQYYNELKDDGSLPQDAGSTLTEAIKASEKYGICKESIWPYDTAKFAQQPPEQAYSEAVFHKTTQAKKLPQVLSALKGCLAGGHPFITGISVYESFESDQVAQTGIVPMPNVETEKNLGGHAVCCIGYDESEKTFLVRNSWGVSWGLEGYFTIPFDYFTSSTLSGDFWYITQVDGKTRD